MEKSPSELEVKKGLETFAEAILQYFLNAQNQMSDSLEVYQLTLHLSIHKNSEDFKKRFMNGYFALTKNF